MKNIIAIMLAIFSVIQIVALLGFCAITKAWKDIFR